MQKKYLSIAVTIMFFIFSSAYSQSETTTSTTVTNASGSSVAPTSSTVIKTTTTTSAPAATPKDTDQKIIADIYAKYAKESALIGTNLSVECLNGFVIISGTVTAQSQEDQAVIVAKSIPGVKDAKSNIDVTTNPKNTKDNTVPNY